MAVINVTFGTMSGIGENSAPAPIFKPDGASEEEDIGSNVVTTATSAQAPGRGVVRIVAEAICYVEIGPPTGLTASNTTSMRMSAGQTQHFACDNGDAVAVIQP